MLPETDNNYGQESCAILCLHPLISSPPLLVIADSKGTLYHCVVLSKMEDDEALETASQISDWSSSIGMISHKKSLITIFGHKHKIKNFIKKFGIFHKKKNTTAFDFGLYLE